MELEQVLKQVDWLDGERRKDKTVLAGLEDRLTNLEGNIPVYGKQIKDIDSEITRLTAMLSRMDHFDENLLQFRVESKHTLEELEKELKQRDDEAEKIRRVEQRAIEGSVVELRKELAPIPELRRAIQASCRRRCPFKPLD